MNKILFLLFFLSPVLIEAQEVVVSKLRFGITGGLGTYNHSDLKGLNQNAIDQLPFDAKILNEFEPNFTFGAYTQYELFKRFLIGPEYHYYYTGSRLGQKDYSGVYLFDQYLNAHAIGLKLDFIAFERNRLSINYQLNTGSIFSKWEMDSELMIGEETESQIDKLKGFSWYVNPAVSVKYGFISHLLVVFSVGYSFDLMKDYHYEANRDFEITKKPDWSGLRLSLGLEYKL